jgi:hypothetical protein
MSIRLKILQYHKDIIIENLNTMLFRGETKLGNRTNIHHHRIFT